MRDKFLNELRQAIEHDHIRIYAWNKYSVCLYVRKDKISQVTDYFKSEYDSILKNICHNKIRERLYITPRSEELLRQMRSLKLYHVMELLK
jgi:hypothetical protein